MKDKQIHTSTPLCLWSQIPEAKSQQVAVEMPHGMNEDDYPFNIAEEMKEPSAH